jgi:hypothetical protein
LWAISCDHITCSPSVHVPMTCAKGLCNFLLCQKHLFSILQYFLVEIMHGAQRFAMNKTFQAFDQKYACRLARNVLMYIFKYTLTYMRLLKMIRLAERNVLKPIKVGQMGKRKKILHIRQIEMMLLNLATKVNSILLLAACNLEILRRSDQWLTSKTNKCRICACQARR